MTFRSLAAPAALAALLLSLWGCAGKSVSGEPAGQDALTAGNAAFAQKDYATACRQLNAADGGAETRYKAGLACARDGQAKAERAYKAALTADPAYAAAMEQLGLAAFAASDLGQARDMLQAAAKAGGADPRAAMTLGESYLLLGNCRLAISAFQEALRRDPGLLTARARLDAARLLCGARKASSPAPAASQTPTRPAVPSVSGGSGPSAVAPTAGAKSAPKGEGVVKTIDLNDI